MALTPSQKQIGSLIITIAMQHGISLPHARELVAAAYAESGLNPNARNKSSGAAGLFQLLSSGYVNKANQAGGVYNPKANINAILPDYANYWKQHPNAAPGDAGRDVERSGMGSSFYSSPLSLVAGLNGGGQIGGAGAVPTAPAPAASDTAWKQNLARQLISGGGNVNLLQVALSKARSDQQQPQPPVRAPAAPAQTQAGVSAAGGFPKMVQHGGEIPGEPGLYTAPQADASHVDTKLLTLLSQYAQATGSHVQIISGYRDPAYSAKVGGYSTDPHTRGVAVDAYVNGVPIGNVPGAFAWLKAHGLESGAQPGFYRGKSDPMHVQIPGSGVNKSIRAKRTLR